MTNVQLTADTLCIGGKPKILLCASLFYFRIPRENWEERMVQLCQTGYNCIDVYLPWNFHELRPGEWHFEDMHDVAAFLTMAAKHGLYVIARPGPYICSEWDGGALPAWLYGNGHPLRQDDPAYLAKLNGWLEKILPIIAKYEEGRGGSVVAVQLENELDYFACKTPGPYLEKLRDTARACGITVPLTACAGQCDVQGACGYAQDVSPTFNAYTEEKFPYLESQLTHMRALAAEQSVPLMITETDRTHHRLKRLLACGARLIAPYNQVGGSNIDMTNGLSNWAADPKKPISLIATDYDFESMITVDGRLRKEAGIARLMNGMIESLGAHLAASVPCLPPVQPECDFPTAIMLGEDGRETPCYPSLKMDCGWLLGATNLGANPGVMRFAAEGESACVPFQPGETKLLPWKLSLAPWGCDTEILFSEAEICAILDRNGVLEVTFTGDAEARAVVMCGGERFVIHGEAWLPVGPTARMRVLPQENAIRECPMLPEMTAHIPSRIRTREIREVVAEPFRLREHAHFLGDGIRPMEDAGIYRGDVFYETDTGDDLPLLIRHAADYVWAERGQEHMAAFSDGGSMLLEGGAGPWSLRVQSWGHSNFDDMRQPSLVMGSKKGIEGMVRVLEQQEITGLWTIYPEGKYAAQNRPELRETDRILATTINTWSFPVTPMKADFVRRVFLRADCDSFWLHMDAGDAQVRVWVDGTDAGSFACSDPWLDLSAVTKPGQSAELRLNVSRRFGHIPLGRVTLVSGQQIRQARMYGFSVDDWQTIQPQRAGEITPLPIALEQGEERLLVHILPVGEAKPRTLALEGEGLEATLIAHRHVVGRVQLPTPGYPEIKGGNASRIYLPAEWADGTVALHLCPLGRGAVLKGLRWEEIVT